MRLTGSAVVELNRAIAVAEVDEPRRRGRNTSALEFAHTEPERRFLQRRVAEVSA